MGIEGEFRVQRKVFRIEKTLAMGHKTAATAARRANGAATHDRSAARAAGSEHRMTRAAGELGAAVEGMEKAVQTILHSAEAIDDCAKALAVAHTNGHERKLAEDVQDHLTHIFEACNFQDIAGQRIGKVIETLSTVDNRRTPSNGDDAAPETAGGRRGKTSRLLNGPRLDGEAGSVSQHDIDAMFS